MKGTAQAGFAALGAGRSCFSLSQGVSQSSASSASGGAELGSPLFIPRAHLCCWTGQTSGNPWAGCLQGSLGLKCTHLCIVSKDKQGIHGMERHSLGTGAAKGLWRWHRQDKALQSTSHTTRAPGSWLLFPPHLGCWKRGKTREFISNTSPCSTGDLFRALELPGEAGWEVFMWCLTKEGGKGGEGWQLWRARSAPAVGSLSH